MTGEAKATTINDEFAKLAEVLNTRDAMVLNETFIFNHQFLHPRMLDIFTKVLKFERNSDLNAIVICETGPGDRYGEYFKHEKIMAIYLDYTLTETFKAIENKNPEFGISPAIWLNLIFTFCHELHHNIAFVTDPEMAKITDTEILDKQADEWALHMLEEIQRTMDAESPAIGQLPWFGTRIMQHMIEKIQAGNQIWIDQKEMADAGLIFNKRDDKYTSLREYYKDSSSRQIWENEGAELELKATVPELGGDKEPEPIDAFDQATQKAEAEMARPVTEQYELLNSLNREKIQEIAAEVDPNFPLNAHPTGPAGAPIDPEDLADMDMIEQLNEPTGEADEPEDPFAGTGSYVRNDHVGDFVATGTTKSTPAQLPPGLFGIKTITEAARAMWMTLYNHMFSVCGWQGGKFTNPRAVYPAAPISKDPITAGMVVKSYTVNENNQPAWIPCINGVHGRTFVEGTIPGYDVELTCGGQQVNIRLIVQNPAKTSQYAQRARQGDRIAWVINGKDFVGLIDNGVYYTKGADGGWAIPH